jgi:protein-disulfide isomerase
MSALYFSYISATRIKTHCILCLGSHAASFALFFLSWIILRRFCGGFSLHRLNKGVHYILNSLPLKTCLLSLIAVIFSLQCWLTPYWNVTFPPPNAVTNGLTEDGHPWIGAKHPELTIHEYTDYQCFQCSKMHTFLRQLINEYPQKIRLVHHHYPMDHEFNNLIIPEPFHIGSGKMAMIAIYAASKNKFWEMNDALYAIGRKKEPFNTRTLAAMTGFTSGELAAATRHPKIREMLLYDIRQGMKREITGTPTFVIDGKVYAGSIPATIIQKGLQ